MLYKRIVLLLVFVIVLCNMVEGNPERYNLIKGNMITICDEDLAGANIISTKS